MVGAVVGGAFPTANCDMRGVAVGFFRQSVTQKSASSIVDIFCLGYYSYYSYYSYDSYDSYYSYYSYYSYHSYHSYHSYYCCYCY